MEASGYGRCCRCQSVQLLRRTLRKFDVEFYYAKIVVNLLCHNYTDFKYVQRFLTQLLVYVFFLQYFDFIVFIFIIIDNSNYGSNPADFLRATGGRNESIGWSN